VCDLTYQKSLAVCAWGKSCL